MTAQDALTSTLPHVEPLGREWLEPAERRLLSLTKPPGSLGRLESLASRLCAIQQTLRPTTWGRRILVFAADHGVTAEGVSAYPAEVTPQMVANFVAGGAAVNALAGVARSDVWAIDVGVAGPIPSTGSGARLVSRRVREGTRNMAQGAAMTESELMEAFFVGLEMADRAARDGAAVIGLGEMGIGNTTAASAITAALLDVPAARVTGRGTGVDDVQLQRKIAVVERALRVNRPRRSDPLDILMKVGGLEIAALCGACIGGAARRRVVVIDGFISTAGALLAVQLSPAVGDYLFAAHRSPEPGHALQLEHLKQRPLLDLDLRLGEGTGAALAMNVLGGAVAIFNEMATFESAGVSDKS